MHRYFSTPPIFSAPVSSIDRENGIIYGVTIAQVGPAKGHNGFVDREFLIQLVDNANSKPAGIKARFGHPNMCSQALGTYLGRFKNYSYSKDKIHADLYLDNTARISPGGDLFNYILDMAANNPDMFGASIVFEIAESVFLHEEVDGKAVEKEYFRLKDLRATDIVDEPAATDGLFSADTLPALATQFLDDNPLFMDLIFSKPYSLIEFLSNYISNSKMNLPEKIMQNFEAFLARFSNPPIDPPALSTEHTALSTDHNAPSTEHPALSTMHPALSNDQTVPRDSTLDTLFDALCKSFPESFSVSGDLTQLQKAESLSTYFSTVHAQLSETNMKLTETTQAFNVLNVDHQELLSEIETVRRSLAEATTSIQDLTEQLSARPSIPLNVTDPAISLSGTQELDETGKQILSQLPKDLKRKLKTHSQTTE